MGHVLAGVDGLLQPAVQLAPLDERQACPAGWRTGRRRSRGRSGRPRSPAGRSRAEWRWISSDFFMVAAQPDGLLEVRARSRWMMRARLDRLRRRPVDAEHLEAVGRLLHVVQHVVEHGGQRVDVLAVERRDEAAVEGLDDRSTSSSPASSSCLISWLRAGRLSKAVTRSRNLPRPRQHRRHLVEHVEELLLSWNQVEAEQSHAASLPESKRGFIVISYKFHSLFMKNSLARPVHGRTFENLHISANPPAGRLPVGDPRGDVWARYQSNTNHERTKYEITKRDFVFSHFVLS